MPQLTDNDADADSDATERIGSDAAEHDTEHDEAGDATRQTQDGVVTKNAEYCDGTEYLRGDFPVATAEPSTTKQRRRSRVVSEEQPGDGILPPFMTSIDADTTVADTTEKKQMFTKSLAHRDDWLHRGLMLRDMDYYHYSRFVERVGTPRSGGAQSFQTHHGVYYLFVAHYKLAKTYV